MLEDELNITVVVDKIAQRLLQSFWPYRKVFIIIWWRKHEAWKPENYIYTALVKTEITKYKNNKEEGVGETEKAMKTKWRNREMLLRICKKE